MTALPRTGSPGRLRRCGRSCSRWLGYPSRKLRERAKRVNRFAMPSAPPENLHLLLATMKRAAAALREAGIAFMLGGGLAIWARGGPERDHDLGESPVAGYEVKGVPDGRAVIIVATGNFHGRTTTIIGFSDDPLAHDHYGPYTPGFVSVPFGDLEALREAITDDVVAVLLEPIQGESGVRIPPAGYMAGVRELTSQHRVLFIADEIQSGLGRTGRTLALEHENVTADVYLLGKALGGGIVPLSAVVADHDVLGVLKPGQHGSTFGGNALACAIGRAVVRLLETGDYEGSITRAFESVTRAREAGHALWVGRTLQNLAVALYLVDRNDEAWTAASESLAIAHAIGDAQLLFKTFDVLGALLARRGEDEHSTRLLGAADALSTRTGYAREGVDRDVRRNVETDLLQSIGKSRYETALAEGQALSLDEAVELALGLLS